LDDRRIGREAALHHGVFTAPFLASIGVNAAQARRRVRCGRWTRLHEGVFSIEGVPPTFALRATAALAAMPHAVLSGEAGSRVLQLGPTTEQVELSVPHHSRHRLAGAVIRQTVLPAHHVTRRCGFRVTTVERTLIDLATALGIDALQRCIEDQLVARRTTLARVESVFDDLAAPGRNGIARARLVLARMDPQPPTESELEASFWRLLQRNRLPLPERQASFDWLGDGRGRVDFWYPGAALVVELDGRRFHARVRAFEADRTRDQLGLMAGIRTVRFTHRQLATERAFVASVVRTLLAG
jgi:very-short-patch-repair endonuclease